MLAASRLFLMMPELPKGTRSGLGERWTYRMFTQAWSNLLEVTLRKGKAGSCLGWQKDEGRKATASSTGTGTLCGPRLDPRWLGRGSRAASPGTRAAQVIKATPALWPPRQGVTSQLNSCSSPTPGKSLCSHSLGLKGRGHAVCSLGEDTGRAGPSHTCLHYLPRGW